MRASRWRAGPQPGLSHVDSLNAASDRHTYLSMRRARRYRPVSCPPQSGRYRGGNGCAYTADVVERARVLVVGTTWPEAAIAAHVGIGVATVNGWKRQRGWQRPEGVPLARRAVGLHRAGFTRRVRAAFERLATLASYELARCRRGDDAEALRRAEELVERVRDAACAADCRRTGAAPRGVTP